MLKLDSEFDAEEVVQDVFTNLWRRRNVIDIRYTFHTYIASCVKYEILSKLKQRQKENKFRNQTENITEEEVNPTENWIYYETIRKQIEDTVKTLPEKCRLVFHLSRNEGYSQKEIAEKLKISTKTVETHNKGIKSHSFVNTGYFHVDIINRRKKTLSLRTVNSLTLPGWKFRRFPNNPSRI